MYMERPVICCDSGGPLETVGARAASAPARGFVCRSGTGGYQGTGGLDDTGAVTDFAAAMLALCGADGEDVAKRMGVAGRAHMLAQFSFAAFRRQWARLVADAVATTPAAARGRWRSQWLAVCLALMMVLLVVVPVLVVARVRPHLGM